MAAGPALGWEPARGSRCWECCCWPRWRRIGGCPTLGEPGRRAHARSAGCAVQYIAVLRRSWGRAAVAERPVLVLTENALFSHITPQTIKSVTEEELVSAQPSQAFCQRRSPPLVRERMFLRNNVSMTFTGNCPPRARRGEPPWCPPPASRARAAAVTCCAAPCVAIRCERAGLQFVGAGGSSSSGSSSSSSSGSSSSSSSLSSACARGCSRRRRRRRPDFEGIS